MTFADRLLPAQGAHDPRPGLARLTPGLRRVPTLAAMLPEWRLVDRRAPADVAAVMAWGHRPSAEVAETFAARHGLPLIRVEDGFLRSVELGNRCPPLSIVIDDLGGIHYDPHRPSRLEQQILQPRDGAAIARALALQQQWVEARVSKYNPVRDGRPGALRHEAAQAPVLVIDQTAGDASIAGSGADATSFPRLLEAALDEHPHAPVWLKVHPDVIAGRRRGHFEALSAATSARVTLIAGDVHPPALLEVCRAVYVVSSQMGFEALLHGRPVRCFGLPFYAGWGLTEDHLPAPARRRGQPRTLADLVHAALIEHPRHLDPETGRRCEPERLIEHLALQRQMRARWPAQVQALGFSRWKRPIVQAFLQGSQVEPVRQPQQLDPARAVAVWGRRDLPGLQPGTPVLRLEDGFVRSVGLGAELVRPLSWIVDDLGLHFDASRPSRLEQLLQHHAFDEPLRRRAAILRQALIQAGLTKYNVGQGDWRRPEGARRVVLVPGQVETDASIRWGCAQVRDNAALLAAARRAEPGAWLVYKPHPDVLAGLRRGERDRVVPGRDCDEVVTTAPMHRLLDQVDAVHVMTSLAGFEALLRGREVIELAGHRAVPLVGAAARARGHHLGPALLRRLGPDRRPCAARLARAASAPAPAAARRAGRRGADPLSDLCQPPLGRLHHAGAGAARADRVARHADHPRRAAAAPAPPAAAEAAGHAGTAARALSVTPSCPGRHERDWPPGGALIPPFPPRGLR